MYVHMQLKALTHSAYSAFFILFNTSGTVLVFFVCLMLTCRNWTIRNKCCMWILLFFFFFCCVTKSEWHRVSLFSHLYLCLKEMHDIAQVATDRSLTAQFSSANKEPTLTFFLHNSGHMSKKISLLICARKLFVCPSDYPFYSLLFVFGCIKTCFLNCPYVLLIEGSDTEK